MEVWIVQPAAVSATRTACLPSNMGDVQGRFGDAGFEKRVFSNVFTRQS